MRHRYTVTIAAASALALLLAGSAPAQPPNPTDPDSYTEPGRRTDAWFKKIEKDKIPPNQRVVRVVVRDPAGKPVARANVIMKEIASGKTDSRQTLETGEYIFNGLNRNADYEFTAQANGKSSPPRKISQYLPNPALSIDLRLGAAPANEPGKPEPKPAAAK